MKGSIKRIAGHVGCVDGSQIFGAKLLFKLAHIIVHLQFDTQLLCLQTTLLLVFINPAVVRTHLSAQLNLTQLRHRDFGSAAKIQIYIPLNALNGNSIFQMLKYNSSANQSPTIEVVPLPKTSQHRLPSNLCQLINTQQQPGPTKSNMAALQLSYVLGTNHSKTVSANIYAYGKSELIYYLKNMFVKYNRCTQNYRIFYELPPNEDNTLLEAKNSHHKPVPCPRPVAEVDTIKQDNKQQVKDTLENNILLISKYFTCGQLSLFAVLKLVDGFFYLSLFWTELEQPVTVIKISQDPREVYTNFTFHEKKGYIYLLYKLRKQQNSPILEKQQYLKIIEIQTPLATQSSSAKALATKFKGSKLKILLNTMIKKTGGSFHDLDDLIVGAQPNQLYLFGLDYFRQWNVLFNEKSLKESNYRNTERNIKKQKIVQIFWINDSLIGKREEWKVEEISSNLKKCSDGNRSQHNYLVIVTAREVLFVRNNQLIHISEIPDQSPFEKTHRETAELILQKSLNQIYKTKFRVDTVSEENENEEKSEKSNKTQSRITAASKPWIENTRQSSNFKENESNSKLQQKQTSRKEQKCVKFCAAFDSSRIFIYRIQNDFSLKLETNVSSFSNCQGIIPKESHLNKTIKNISTSPDGNLILFTDLLRQNFINNRTEDFENSEIDPIYMVGQGHTSSILSISAPEIVNNFVTVSDDGCLKIWNKSEKQRCLIIDTRFKAKPLEAIMHPCGFLIIVNFGMEIKVYGIVSNQLEQIVAIKTNDYCSGIKFSKMGNFLIANEKNMIKVYDPFTLQGFGKIQPDDLRQEYRKFKVSDNNQYMIYQSCNHKLYKVTVSSIFNPEQGQQEKETQYKNQKEAQFDKPTLCHTQSQEYTCFYFDFGTVRHNTTQALEGTKTTSLAPNNIFVGFTLTKFMAIYSCFGEKLVAEFPVINDTYVTDCCVADHLMFLATNKGSILTYPWPILQSHLDINVSNEKNEKGYIIARLKPPKAISEFIVWKDCSPITAILKIPNKLELAVGGIDGILGVITYRSTHKTTIDSDNGHQNFSSDRQRMIEATNNLKLVKAAQIQKITKLIEKTQNDIEKIEYQVQNEKDRRNKQMEREEAQLKMNSLQRQKAYLNERKQKQQEQERQLDVHRVQYEKKKRHLERLIMLLEKDCKENSDYERQRIKQIEVGIQKEKKNHKQRILKLIQSHKANIQKVKDQNLASIRALQDEFEALVSSKYKQQEIISQVQEVSAKELTENEQISSQKLKVFELENIIADKSEQFAKITTKSDGAKREDEIMQKKFERNLEKYNEYRYENLILHSQLLKIQNQLYERKEILQKKDEIINMVYQEKEINETFKQFVSGTISGLQDQKQKAYEDYIKKQQNLRMLFEELTLEINKSGAKKLKLVELKQAIKILERENTEKKKNIKISIEQLKNFKKYLLVQGVSEDTEHKRFYQEQEKLLSTIKWLEKRFRMNCINEKKMTVLKKSGVNQVVNQNKNLLEECNQLREEGIIYENEIDHLSKKLAEANMIIELEKKVSNQDRSIIKQSEKLNQIRKMFQAQIASHQEIEQMSQNVIV